MGIREFFTTVIPKDKEADIQQVESQETPNKEAVYNNSGYSSSNSVIFTLPFDGEKNLGEIGPVKRYLLDYDRLRLRSWQSYLESEITQTVLGKFCKWVIGSGLKLQSEPNKLILKESGIDTESIQDFSKSVEARFNQWSKSKSAAFSNMKSLNEIEKEAFLNAKVGGDVLVILRTVKGRVKVELIDGSHIKYNKICDDYYPVKLANGNVIKNGIEFKSTGEHVAYYVKDYPQNDARRIKARNSNGTVQAFLVKGLRYKLDNHRGIPLISVVLETLKKLERYKEAVVGSAEERQKIVYQIVHGTSSTGESIYQDKQMARAFDYNSLDIDLPKDINGENMANTIAASTNKETFNMPIDSELKTLDSRNELYFKEFYDKNIDIVCACLGIPPEVAMSKYDSNFSASRAALKDWEHTLITERNEFREQFMQYVYDYWFEIMANTSVINPSGYMLLDQDGKEAYRNARFLGANVPHIDPEKEVRAERLKLGTLGDHLPLGTQEMSTEALNSGDSVQNTMKFSQELQEAEELDVEPFNPMMPQEPIDNSEEQE